MYNCGQQDLVALVTRILPQKEPVTREGSVLQEPVAAMHTIFPSKLLTNVETNYLFREVKFTGNSILLGSQIFCDLNILFLGSQLCRDVTFPRKSVFPGKSNFPKVVAEFMNEDKTEEKRSK